MESPNNITGLSDIQVTESRERYGFNILSTPPSIPLWKQFLLKFNDPLIKVLLVAGILSIGISIYEYYSLGLSLSVFFEPAGIFMAILLATVLAFVFEMKANKEFSLLNKVDDDVPVPTIRNGRSCLIPKRQIVVGDVVIVESGMEIPADGRLLSAVNLNMDESSLTGEPQCRKTIFREDFDPEATYPSDMVLRGTKVLEGHGMMEVSAVGDATENGKVFHAAQIDTGVKTPLSIQLEKLGRLVSYGSYTVAAMVVVGRLLMYFMSFGQDFQLMSFLAYILQTIMIAVTLIVVAVPEGLPMAVTLSLAYSIRRMLKSNNLVRKLHACETMGAATVICTDKTGTLTQNKMQVADVYFDPEDKRIYENMAVNSTADVDMSDPANPVVIGNPTEGALLMWMTRNNVDFNDLRRKYEKTAEFPFSTENKYMATLVLDLDDGRFMLYVKGAPEIVMSLCNEFPEGYSRGSFEKILHDCQARAMRTLGFACRELTSYDGTEFPSLSGMRFMGVCAISDPVRPDVPEAVRTVSDAGISVKMVTGDTVGTAKEIGRQIGIWKNSDPESGVITGSDFEKLSDDELSRRAGDIKIIARARPMDKKRLVEALQRQGNIVAVTGDGTNDAPALKAAHVGLSMGDGTSVAKEASDITILDDSFTSIGRAVMWGRSLYKNIRRFILFQLIVNVAACLLVLVGSFMGIQSPLTVTQMLWVNLIMDTFAAVALASLPPSEKVMLDKPRNPSSSIISKSMAVSIISVGIVFFAVMIWLLWYFEHSDIHSLLQIGRVPFIVENKGLSPYEQSLLFTIFVFLQFWNLFNVKAFDSRRSAFHFRGCSGFLLISFIIFAGQVLIVEAGGEFFNVTALRFEDWVIIVTATSMVLFVPELLRVCYRLLSARTR